MFTDATTLGNSVLYQTPGGYLGMNTTAPQAAFHAVSWTAPVAYFDVFSNALSALPVVYRAARGTPAAPMAVRANDILGGLAVRGYGATTWSTGRGQVMYKAAEHWTDGAQGTYLQFTTTPTGTATWVERLRIASDGKVGIGTPTPAQMLSVAGVVQSTMGGFLYPDGTAQTTAARIVSGYGVAFGTDALGSVTTGMQNAAFGAFALRANTEGDANTASGFGALAANTTGSYNTASGYRALFANTTGYNNTVSGYRVLTANTTGANNTASGVNALQANTAGSRNTAIGVDALHYATGDDNIAVGYGAGWNLTTGSDNIVIGNDGVSAENRYDPHRHVGHPNSHLRRRDPRRHDSVRERHRRCWSIATGNSARSARRDASRTTWPTWAGPAAG